ncbi:hypothetical protein SPRG_16689 [Saprolegnia parasitica CBS 223.65]|uniref:Rab-GAP TBC domain-containing protein n=1 Tax=Saprolegnia parasitica (strain CBS 223.65) TaxID=695850 RepID=A0A067BUD7_SAPPC|nr:hypothetical protein SPRG_16689 [Saprolegnia parasitica CBS 223.65]KDO17906.1 hypothetical protein SPRG_16689 [Saprolegnia parasitica CBS 223.65]|eukprot:XP_012211385.1 hypothetical protein SPRG_16689 [Saprolegnia parasitica CBS 223.65]
MSELSPLDLGAALGDDARRTAWTAALASRIERLRRQSPLSYEDYGANAMYLTKTTCHDVAMDAPRSGLVDRPSDEAALQRVLLAYATRNAQIGYCQGMHVLGAMLLRHLHDEATAFWALAIVLEELMIAYHTPDMAGLAADHAVLTALLPTLVPEVAARLTTARLEPPVFATKWFVTAFANTLPLRVAERIWDALLLRVASSSADAGCILLGTAAALLATLELADVPIDDDPALLLQYIQSIPDKCVGSVEDQDAFLARAFALTERLCPFEVSQLRGAYACEQTMQADAKRRLTASPSPAWAIAIYSAEPTKLCPRGFSRWRKSKKTPLLLDYDVAFAPGALGLVLTQDKIDSAVRVYGYIATTAIGKLCNMIQPGDAIMSVNGVDCAGQPLLHVVHELAARTDRYRIVRFQRTVKRAVAARTTKSPMYSTEGQVHASPMAPTASFAKLFARHRSPHMA